MFKFVLLCSTATVLFAQPSTNPIAKIYDGDLSTIESELVPLVEAMPEAKFGFAPTDGYAIVGAKRADARRGSDGGPGFR